MAQFRGLAYPLQIANGRLVISEDFGLIEDQIVSVLETRPLERVMRSDYGFDPAIFSTLEPTAINAKISAAVEAQVPDVENLEVSGNISSAEEGVYQVILKYSVNGIPAPPLNLSLNM